MDSRDILDMTENIKKEEQRLEEEFERLELERKKIMDLCPHEIVIKYRDNHPRMLPIEGNYYCPICCKSIGTNNIDYFKESAFKNSRVIELSNISIVGNTETLYKIRKEVLDNTDLYYNSNATNEELALRIEDVLKDNIYDYYKNVLKMGNKNS